MEAPPLDGAPDHHRAVSTRRANSAQCSLAHSTARATREKAPGKPQRPGRGEQAGPRWRYASLHWSDTAAASPTSIARTISVSPASNATASNSDRVVGEFEGAFVKAHGRHCLPQYHERLGTKAAKGRCLRFDDGLGERVYLLGQR